MSSVGPAGSAVPYTMVCPSIGLNLGAHMEKDEPNMGVFCQFLDGVCESLFAACVLPLRILASVNLRGCVILLSALFTCMMLNGAGDARRAPGGTFQVLGPGDWKGMKESGGAPVRPDGGWGGHGALYYPLGVGSFALLPGSQYRHCTKQAEVPACANPCQNAGEIPCQQTGT